MSKDNQNVWSLKRSLFRLEFIKRKTGGPNFLINTEKQIVLDKIKKLEYNDIDSLSNLLMNWKSEFEQELKVFDQESEEIMNQVNDEIEKLH